MGITTTIIPGSPTRLTILYRAGNGEKCELPGPGRRAWSSAQLGGCAEAGLVERRMATGRASGLNKGTGNIREETNTKAMEANQQTTQ